MIELGAPELPTDPSGPGVPTDAIEPRPVGEPTYSAVDPDRAS